MIQSLMDTHTFLWLADDDPRLSSVAYEAAIDRDVQRFVSVISIWEVAIKMSIGKFKFDVPLSEYVSNTCNRFTIEILPLEVEHTIFVSTLPFPHHNHKEPFDRLLISQCLCLNIPIISVDEKFDAYGVQRIW